jgi:hypothetical protein
MWPPLTVGPVRRPASGSKQLCSNKDSISLSLVAEFGSPQLIQLRQGITDLIEALEVGAIPYLDPHERLDLWQYLHAVRSRLILVERALARKDLGGPRPENNPVEKPGSTAACG